MLKLKTTLAFFMLSVFLFGQTAITLESEDLGGRLMDKEGAPILTGKFEHFTTEEILNVKAYFSAASPSSHKQVTGIIEVSTDGFFEIKMEHYYPYREIIITFEDLFTTKVILEKGLHMTLNYTLLEGSQGKFTHESVQFAGEDAEMNRYVSSYENFKSERKQELLDEKLNVLMDIEADRNEKVKELQRVYKRYANIEESYARKQGRKYQWILSDDRIASMYADLISIYWTKQMHASLYRECLGFVPRVTSNSSIRYYHFLGYALTQPSRIEQKLLTERTLEEHLDGIYTTADLDVFLREFNKKVDHLMYDQEIYHAGEKVFLKRYSDELLNARLYSILGKIWRLPKGKREMVMLLSQPSELRERERYLEIAQEKGFLEWSIDLAYLDHAKDLEAVASSSRELKSRKIPSARLGDSTYMDRAFIANHGSVVNLLQNLSSIYPDSALILHFWNPWGGCNARDLESNIEVSTTLDSLPVKWVHLFSSLEHNEEEWYEAIPNLEIKGDHIFLNHKLSLGFKHQFGIHTFPNFIFVDLERSVHPYLISSMQTLEASRILNTFKNLDGS